MNRLAAAALVLVVAACGGDDATEPSTTTTTQATTTTEASTTTVLPTTTTTLAATTTTAVAAIDPEAGLLIANDDGAFLVDTDFTFQLVTGPVELAIDDAAGGLVFQRSSARSGQDPAATFIEYLGPDALEPRPLLVPAENQFLTLSDARDGVVWFTRRDSGGTPETTTETLRTYDIVSSTEDEFTVTGGWESGALDVSVGGDTVVAYWSAEATTGFVYFDAASAARVGFAGDPYQSTQFCVDGSLYDETTGGFVAEQCFEFAQLSDDGRLAYYERAFDGVQVRYVLVVVDLDSGAELFRQDLERPDQGWAPVEVDVLGDLVLVNRTETGVFDAPYIGALLVELSTGAVSEVGVAGQARFLRGPMAID